MIGHRLRARPLSPVPAPATEALPWDGPSISMGPMGAGRDYTTLGPGPKYLPNMMDSTWPLPHGQVFGSTARQHPSDDVWPDWPPGPGAHDINRDLVPGNSVSQGIGGRARMWEAKGCQELPAPGAHDLPECDPGRRSSLSFHLPLAEEFFPGPGEYEMSGAPPNPSGAGSLKWTSKRKLPFHIPFSPGPAGSTRPVKSTLGGRNVSMTARRKTLCSL